MSRKSELKKLIVGCEQEIARLEKKLTRSQTSLLASYFTNSTPDEQDAEFFNLYMKLIELERIKMHDYQDELSKLD